MVLKFPTNGSIGEYISIALNHQGCVNFLKQETKIQGLQWTQEKKKSWVKSAVAWQSPQQSRNQGMTGKKSNVVACINSELRGTHNIKKQQATSDPDGLYNQDWAISFSARNLS